MCFVYCITCLSGYKIWIWTMAWQRSLEESKFRRERETEKEKDHWCPWCTLHTRTTGTPAHTEVGVVYCSLSLSENLMWVPLLFVGKRSAGGWVGLGSGAWSLLNTLLINCVCVCVCACHKVYTLLMHWMHLSSRSTTTVFSTQTFHPCLYCTSTIGQHMITH